MGFAPVWSWWERLRRRFPIIPHVETIHIFTENDASGTNQKASQACAQRWFAAGRTVYLDEPDERFKDLNDELRADR
jgi:hypothetical protein